MEALVLSIRCSAGAFRLMNNPAYDELLAANRETVEIAGISDMTDAQGESALAILNK